MHRQNYDRRVIAVFDTIGSFFTDVLYNDLYQKAVDLVNKNLNTGPKSITDAYRNNVVFYTKGIRDRPDLYMTVIKKLHEYYQREVSVAIVFGDFVDKVVSQFIPPEYFGDFTGQNKDKTLNEIILWMTADITEFILTPNILSRIIDDHMNVANVTLIQDKIVDVFVVFRESYYAKFAEKITAAAGGATVPKKIVQKLTDALVEEKQKRVDAEADRDRAVNMLQGCLRKMQEMESSMAELRRSLSQRAATAPQRAQPRRAPEVQPEQSILNDAVEEQPKRAARRPAAQRDSAPAQNGRKKQQPPAPPPPAPQHDESTDTPTEETSSSEESVDDEELHTRQRRAIAKKSKSGTSPAPDENTAPIVVDDDDPGFGR